MTTAVDTNVVIALWDRDSALSLAALTALDAAFNRGALVAAAPVFAELIAAPGRNEAFVTSFFEETGIGIHWELPEQVWRLAGRTFQAYAERRRKQRDAGARRISRGLCYRGSRSVEWLPPSNLRRSSVSFLISDTRRGDLLSFRGREPI